ncbi:DUF3301 domain-containing protein [Vibrio sp. RE86]|uniref:DUF3301 domain-containing protein n=1 Tax=Vibrio sp. RE86 TaxID=2607605 RepID=UPI0014933ADA|nr:DUF3301 domain-containing protein [Vibrio sp. RE86]NOH78953.1 DUF3301 domain-containing protein [Vibrio sp. RE86]
MIHDLFAILALSIVCLLFWQQRRQAEIAKSIAARKCKELDLQLVSVALKGHKLKTPDGIWRWHTVYEFEFSSLGDDCYKAEIIMQGFHLAKVTLPPHRM